MSIDSLNEFYGLIFTLLLSVAVFCVVHYTLNKLLLRNLKYWQFYLVKVIDKPLKTLIVFIGMTYVVEILFDDQNHNEKFHTLKLTIVVSALTWVILAFIKKLERHFLKYNSFADIKEKAVKRSTIIVLMKLCFISALVVAILILLQTLGVRMQAIITFLSLSGVTIGIASRDLTASFFGTIMIYANRQFVIGDIIKFNSLEGTVENITWISTQLRVNNKRLIYIPNIQFLGSYVENISHAIERKLVIIMTVFHSHIPSIKSALMECQDKIREQKVSVEEEEFEPNVKVEILELQEQQIVAKFSIYFNKKITQSDFLSKKDLLVDIFSEILCGYDMRFKVKFEE
jgi:MscS family membrane protein